MLFTSNLELYILLILTSRKFSSFNFQKSVFKFSVEFEKLQASHFQTEPADAPKAKAWVFDLLQTFIIN